MYNLQYWYCGVVQVPGTRLQARKLLAFGLSICWHLANKVDENTAASTGKQGKKETRK